MKLKNILSILLFIIIEIILYIFTLNRMASQVARMHLESDMATLGLVVLMLIIAGGVCLFIKKKFDISRTAITIIGISVVAYCAIAYDAFSGAVCPVCSGLA